MRVIKMLKEKKLKIRSGTTALTICTLELTSLAPHKKGYPLTPTTYGHYLRQARLNKGLTQWQMGLELDVYTSTIDKWERGRTQPNYINKQKIITFLGYDPISKNNINL